MIKMSKPIEFVEKEDEEEVQAIPDKYKESFNNLLETIKNLNDSGFLSMVNALSSNYKYIVDTFSEQFNSDTTKKSLTNIMSIFDLLSKLDPDMMVSLMSRLGDSINNAGTADASGLMGLMRMMNDSEIAGPLSIMLKILAGMSGKP
jgi:uncharacterized protein YjgD (DUF1641 family)